MRKEIDTLRAGIERIEYPREYKQRKKGGIEAERAFVVSKNPFEQGRLEKNEANPDDVGARAGGEQTAERGVARVSENASAL